MRCPSTTIDPVARRAMKCKHFACYQCEDDCGQDGPVCATPPGCSRHWEDRCRELVAERDEARAEIANLRGEVIAAQAEEKAAVEAADKLTRERDEARAECERLRSVKPVGTYSLDLQHEEERRRLTMERDAARAEVAAIKAATKDALKTVFALFVKKDEVCP